MSLPIRCFTCNKVISPFYCMLTNTEKDTEILRCQNITRYCCKRMLLTSVDITPYLNSYPSKDCIIDDNHTYLSVTCSKPKRLSTIL